ncbi:MAG: hypothetical protein IJ520_12815, partial [Synergistaceae bacterium]|nr:hypothetical protein [Synergistaceae bacterium]
MIARAEKIIKIINEDAPDLVIDSNNQLELLKSSIEPVIEIDIKSLNSLKTPEPEPEQNKISEENLLNKDIKDIKEIKENREIAEQQVS